jgi:hypothetical protein
MQIHSVMIQDACLCCVHYVIGQAPFGVRVKRWHTGNRYTKVIEQADLSCMLYRTVTVSML